MKLSKLHEVSCKYGAPMGRSNCIEEPDQPIRFRLVRMRMVDGDYDEGGAYWGGGNATIGWMYRAVGEGEQWVNQIFVRATTRDGAKAQVRERFPKAKFYR